MGHIFFITHWYPSPDQPTQGIFIQEHARAVARLARVSVAHIRGIGAGRLVDDEGSERLRVYRVIYPRPAVPKTAWLERFRQTERLLRRLLAEPDPPTILHAQVYSSADLAVYLSKKYGLPAVLSEHSSAYARGLFSSAQAWKARLALNQLGLVMPVCETLAAEMRRFGIRSRFEIVPNTVDTELFYPAEERVRGEYKVKELLLVAGLTAVKGVETALEALRLARERFPGLRLTILGDGPERGKLEELTRELGLAGQVRFLGSQPKAAVADWMRQADCLVLSSRWENQPVVILEAQASGLPVAACAVGGVPELVRAENGRLGPPGDAQGLAQAIGEVLARPGQFSRQAIRAEAVAKYSYQAVGERLKVCYQSVSKSFGQGCNS